MRLLASILATSLFVFSNCHSAAAIDYKIDPVHSQVLFKVKHLGISSVTGRFDNFEGTISFDPKNIAASKTQAQIDVLSINTNQTKRDGHLKSCDFFCVEKFPKMTFTSKQVKPISDNKFQIVGDLSLHGISKELTLDAEFSGEAKDPAGRQRAAFTATGSLNRKDFGLKWNDLTETGGVLVGDEVKITIEIEAIDANAKS